MKIEKFPYAVTDWSTVEAIEHPGDEGAAYWQTLTFNDVRVRMVRYSAGYKADHWCQKGHFLLCLEGELQTDLDDGRHFVLTPGMSYQVADQAGAHRSYTETGAKLFIVD
jgi:hypothetical protein